MLEEELQGVSVLVLANKMDLPTALTKEEVFRALEMERLKVCERALPLSSSLVRSPIAACALTRASQASSSHIQDTVAVSGRGVDDGFKWLAEHAQPI
jgi:signal recognition particle receptor subunit beta